MTPNCFIQHSLYYGKLEKRVASPGLMHNTGCLGLVHWNDPEGWCGEVEGGGFRMGSTCIPVVDSFWCLAKLIQCLRFKNKIKKKHVLSSFIIQLLLFLPFGSMYLFWIFLFLSSFLAAIALKSKYQNQLDSTQDFWTKLN